MLLTAIFCTYPSLDALLAPIVFPSEHQMDMSNLRPKQQLLLQGISICIHFKFIQQFLVTHSLRSMELVTSLCAIFLLGYFQSIVFRAHNWLRKQNKLDEQLVIIGDQTPWKLKEKEKKQKMAFQQEYILIIKNIPMIPFSLFLQKLAVPESFPLSEIWIWNEHKYYLFPTFQGDKKFIGFNKLDYFEFGNILSNLVFSMPLFITYKIHHKNLLLPKGKSTLYSFCQYS